jgi:ribosomal protein L11 methyltransferase
VIRLALRVRAEHAEVVRGELVELAPNGWEEDERGEVVEFGLYGAPGELPELPALRAAAGEALFEVVSEEIPDDWHDGWKRFHQPVVVGGHLYVRPPWAAPPPGAGLEDIVIDPGQAFGTGSHDTTRMCMEMMLELEPAGPFADLGCGSGVLAIAAAKLGWGPVLALDHELAAVEAARANALVNGVEVEVRRWDLRDDAVPPAPTVVANLLRPLLLELAQRLADAPRALIAGGLLAAQVDEVAAAFAARGLVERRRLAAGEWAALLLSR